MERTTIPIFLFSVSIAFTISLAAKPAPIGQWPDTLTIYIIGAVVCAVTVVAWRFAIRSSKTARVSQEGAAGYHEMFRRLYDCRDFAARIGTKINELDSDSLCEEVDTLLIHHMGPFVENRHILIDHFGMARGADILLKAAFAERKFNRVWSASSDQCLPEAKVSFQEALAAMDDVVEYVKGLD